MFSNLRGWEWLILLLIVLLLFGARRLPELARSVGRSAKIFRSEVKDLRDDDGTDDHRSGTTTAAPAAIDTSPGTTSTVRPSMSDAVGSPARVAADDDGERHRA
jgi:sec-independent protein translocase protein TatA